MGLFNFLFGSSVNHVPDKHHCSLPRNIKAHDFPYTVLALESANKSKGSICRIAIASYGNDGALIFDDSILVKPKTKTFSFSDKNGISLGSVANAPDLSLVWPRILPYIDNHTVAVHYAPFTILSLQKALLKYSIPLPSFKILDVRDLGEKLWHGLDNYKLDSLASEVGARIDHNDTRSKVAAISKIVEYGCLEKPSIVKRVIRKYCPAEF